MLTVHEENINEFLDDLAEKVMDKLINNPNFITILVENLCSNDESRSAIVEEIMHTHDKYDFTYNISNEIADNDDCLKGITKWLLYDLDYNDLASAVVDRLKDVFKKLNEEA